MSFSIGCDLGQANDFTAIAVVQAIGTKSHLRHLEQVPLGTSYPAIVERIGSMVAAVPAPVRLVIDASGVGRPVSDMLIGSGLSPVSVTITGGSRAVRGSNGFWKVPKAELVRTVAVALESGSLMIARGMPAGDAFLREMKAFGVMIGASGRARFEARGQEHDDLVLAVALALWQPTESTL
jgi:hypothetical protein